MALCKPDISLFAGIRAMVTSPRDALGENGGKIRRYMEFGFSSVCFVNAWMRDGSKCFHPRIFLAAAGVASMVDRLSGGS